MLTPALAQPPRNVCPPPSLSLPCLGKRALTHAHRHIHTPHPLTHTQALSHSLQNEDQMKEIAPRPAPPPPGKPSSHTCPHRGKDLEDKSGVRSERGLGRGGRRALREGQP